jgi:hypothetical protein
MLRSSRFLLVILPVVFAGGCSSLVVTNPNALYYVPPPGSQVVIKQRLEVPPGRTRVFLQYGQVIPKSELNDYAANCDFEVNTLNDKPRYIEPGDYNVVYSERRTDSIVSRGPVYLAALNLSGMEDRGDGTPMVFEEIRLSLTSAVSPDIRELACRGVLTDPSEVLPPTLPEMNQALGSNAEIVPKKK